METSETVKAVVGWKSSEGSSLWRIGIFAEITGESRDLPACMDYKEQGEYPRLQARDESDTLTTNPPTTLQPDIPHPFVGFNNYFLITCYEVDAGDDPHLRRTHHEPPTGS
jgi:hypothetical protein